MEEPVAVLDANAGVQQALRVMQERQVASAFVVSGDRRLVGVVRDEAVAEAVRNGADSLHRLMNPRDVVTVRPNTLVTNLLTPSAQSPVPLAVVTDDGRLRGVIPRVSLLAALGNGYHIEEVDAEEVTAEEVPS